MIYEATITYVGQDKNGNDKTFKEKYVVEEGEFFAEVEQRLYNDFSEYHHADLDVVDIKRSRIKEIANKRESKDDLLWMAEMRDVYLDDEGNEKYTKYKVLFFAKTFDSAKTYITEFMKCGYDMTLVSMKLTKFLDVIS